MFIPFLQQGKPVFLTHVLPAIPTRTEEEIREHEDWYQEYLFLNETKKDAIKKWKEKREVGNVMWGLGTGKGIGVESY